MICDQCETVKHCLEHGCVPKQPALVSKDEALELAKIWFEYNTYGDEAIEVYEAIEQALAAPAQEIVCSTGLCHYKPAAPDLQAELDATNKQVEILSDALAESRREVAALKAVQEPVAWIEQEWSGTGLRHLHFERREPALRDEVVNPVWTPLYTRPQAREPLTDEQFAAERRRRVDEVVHAIKENT
jgi:hypothetical protein